MLENPFGVRQSPSLAEAMHQTPQINNQWLASPICSTPNSVQESISLRSMIRNSSSQREPALMYPIVRHSPAIVEEIDSQPISRVNFMPPPNTRAIPTFDTKQKKRLDEIEKKVCEHLDATLKLHYKTMKKKLKRVKTHVMQTDLSIRKIQDLVESVFEQVDNTETTPPQMQKQQRQMKFNNEPQRFSIFDQNECKSDSGGNFVMLKYEQNSNENKRVTWRRNQTSCGEHSSLPLPRTQAPPLLDNTNHTYRKDFDDFDK